MKHSLNKLTGFSIEAIDGPKGKVKDFLFDEDTWIVRYMEADYGSLFKDRKVLIPGIFFKRPNLEDKQFPVGLTKENVENCPTMEERMPISMEYEKKLSEHYDYKWPWVYAEPVGTLYYPSRPLTVPSSVIDEKDLETSLRSFKEVKDYDINAVNGMLGHVDDLIIDDIDWQVVYVVVDTSNWLPLSKRVILPISQLKEISYVRREVSVDLHTDTIKNAPEFDHDHPLREEDEKELHEYYSRTLVK